MMKMHLKTKPPKRNPMVHSPEEVWDFFRKYNLKIIPDGNDFRFITKDKALLKPLEFFAKIATPLRKEKKNNTRKIIGYRPTKPQWMTGLYGKQRYEPIYGPADMELDKTLNIKLIEMEDYWYSWKELSEKIRLGVDIISKDLLFKSNRNAEVTTIKRRISKAQDKPSLKQWTGSRKDFASFVKGKFIYDQKKEPEYRLFEDLNDASEKLYTQYKFPKTWNWTVDKCYKYVLKVT